MQSNRVSAAYDIYGGFVVKEEINRNYNQLLKYITEQKKNSAGRFIQETIAYVRLERRESE